MSAAERLDRLQRFALQAGARFLAERCEVARRGSGDALVELLDLEASVLVTAARSPLE